MLLNVCGERSEDFIKGIDPLNMRLISARSLACLVVYVQRVMLTSPCTP